MANFIIRPEINNRKDGDYEKLHEALKKQGIYRVIKLTDETSRIENWYDLPTGTYVTTLDTNSPSHVGFLVKSAMNEIGKYNRTPKDHDYEVAIFRWDDGYCDMQINTDTSKLPGK